MQRGLVDDRTADDGRAVGLLVEAQPVEPGRPSVVEVAAFACGEQGEAVGPDIVARLAELATGHEDALVREAAVAALGAIGAPAGLGAIALAPFDGPEVQAALERARSDRDWQVRQAAEDLLD